ncbi:MAG: DUF4407 domain-containing protein [Myxococcota bacterium]|nr:DUF4407 domain-containing protein [Myxococcota bacterium]
MKPSSNPGLSIVTDDDLAPSEPLGTPEIEGRGTPGRGERRRLLVLVLALVVLLVGLLAAQQYRRAESLAARVESLDAQLAGYQSHLREVRGGVADVGARMEALRALVERDPTAPAATFADPDPHATPGD